MRYELKQFQQNAVNTLIKRMESMRRSYEADGSLSAISLTAPTGAGKTLIAAAVAEGLFFGNDVYPGDDQAVILWLSDSPSLNEQTLKRFDAATDLLVGATKMETVNPEFSKSHNKLDPGHIYFLNRQLLASKKKLTNAAEGGRTFYDVLSDTINDKDIHLYLFIDEAHRGLGDNVISDSDSKTIYAKLIDGQNGINPPMPIVVGISATPANFENAMNGRKNRDIKAPVNVPVTDVRASGLIKDTIELRTPKVSSDTKHQDLTYACKKLADSSKMWKDYCVKNEIYPIVTPLMVVQVEDNVSKSTLEELCSQIHKTLPWLDISDCFANVFGEHNDIITGVANIPYIKPESVTEHTEIKVLFAKDAISTGWDCPRAEVIYSRRRRTDPTYIAQLIGRMIRTPLARKITDYEELNTVACYLPEFDAETVDGVVEKLKDDNIAVESSRILRNPVNVGWYGDAKKRLEKKLETHFSGSNINSVESNREDPSEEITKTKEKKAGVVEENEFEVYIEGGELNLNDALNEDFTESAEEIAEALERIPKADSDDIRNCFEGIVTRCVRHDKPNHFLDLWDCADVIMTDLEPDSELEYHIQVDFYNNLEGEIHKHPAEFRRARNEIQNTTVLVKRVDPLTGEEFDDKEELVANDAQRLLVYYRRIVSLLAGASDIVKFYITKRMGDPDYDSETDAISRISAIGNSVEIMQGMETWASEKTQELLDSYGSFRNSVSAENREKWDRIEGNTKPYIERNLNIQASITRQNMDYKKYPKHIISDDDGWAYLNLNPLEDDVVRTELSHKPNVAWYRNQARNLNASLAIPYKIGDSLENMYPDFIFFQKASDGTIIPSIVDPHGDWLGDSIAKLKGYVMYLKDHPDTFGRVLAVTDSKNGECRSLDLMDEKVQKAIDKFSGDTAKTLFHGELSRPYKIVNENA